MERMEVVSKGNPTIMIDCTPQQLRELADQMEKQAIAALPGTSLVWQMTKNVSLHHKVKTDFKFVSSTYRDSDQQISKMLDQ
jgi:hypothetical protein